jgi:glycosyltransferase involved in cell wall biosynthesis
VSDGVRASVVIPVDDEAIHVEAAVRSALASDLRGLEVLVVDNSSTDRSAVAIGNIRDSRLVRVRLRSGRGTSRPRNVGIARATAPYVAFLDSNDLLKPNRLSAAVTALDGRPEAGFAFADFEVVDEGGRIVRPSGIAGIPGSATLTTGSPGDNWRVLRQADLARALLFGNFIETSGVVVRRQLIAEIGPFDEAVACCAALDLWFRLAHRCGALYSSEAGHARRAGTRSDNGATHQAIEECIAVLRREKSRWSERGARNQLDRCIAQYLASVAYRERARRHRLRSTAIFAYAFATSPEVRWLRGMLGSILR